MKLLRTPTTVCTVWLLAYSLSLAANIRVPADKANIQLAINASLPDDTIVVAEGTFSGDGFRDIVFNGKSVVVRSENGPEFTIIDCGGTEAEPHRAFHFMVGDDSTAVVDGLTIMGGFGLPDGPPGSRDRVGGAIFCDSASSPTIQNCIVTGNHAYDGGSVLCYKSSPKFDNCIIAGNEGPTVLGGAIYAHGSQLEVTNCTFSNNYGYWGGAISLWFGSSATIVGTVFESDSATFGGGVYLSESEASIRHCSFIDGKATDGAGLYLIRSNASISQCTFANGAATLGAGLYLKDSHTSISNSTFAYGTAIQGGVVYGGTTQMEFTTMHHNEAEESGACLDFCDATVTNCTMISSVGEGGVIDHGSLAMSHSIIAFNYTRSVLNVEGVQISCSDIFGNRYEDWEESFVHLLGQDGNISVDPELCDTATGEVGLWYLSPCLPENSACGLVGAGDLGCVDSKLPVAGKIGYGDKVVTYAVRSLTPQINWLYTDTLPTFQTAFELQVGADRDWTVAECWSSGEIISPDTFIVYDGSPLENRSTYYLRIRLKGNGSWGSWTEERFLVRVPPDNNGFSDWTTFQGNQQHTGYNDLDQITLPLQLSWSKDLGSLRMFPPTVVRDHLIVSEWGNGYRIWSLDALTGDSLWCQEFCWDQCSSWLSQASYVNDMLYFHITTSGNSHLRTVELETGETIWDVRYRTQWYEPQAPAVSEGRSVFEAGFYGGVAGCNSITGEPLWSMGLGAGQLNWDAWSPTIWDGLAWVLTGGNLRALDINTGVAVYYHEGFGYDHGYRTAPVLDTTRMLLYGQALKSLSVLDINTQTRLWMKIGDWRRYHPTYVNGFTVFTPILYDSLLITVESNDMVAYHGPTGEELWRIKEYPLEYSLVGANGLVFGGSDSVTIAVDIETQQIIWKCDVGGQMAIANNRLYIAPIVNGKLYCYGPVPTDVEDSLTVQLPSYFTLGQNYPNPFNPSTIIEYNLPLPADVRLVVYNVLGQEVETLVFERQSAGRHTVSWNASSRSSGIYFYRLTAGDFIQTKKMVLLK